MDGHPYQTWTSENDKIFWPAQLLPAVIEEEKARILVYGYDADIASFTGTVSKDKLHNHADNLVAELYANRRKREATDVGVSQIQYEAIRKISHEAICAYCGGRFLP